MVNISAGRLGVLVNGADGSQFAATRSQDDNNPGALHVFQLDGRGFATKDVTSAVESGTLGGYLQVRDRIVPELMGKVDNLAHSLASEVNAVHGSAYTSKGQAGVNFFEVGADPRGAAASLKLSKAIGLDLGNLATGSLPNAPGDNRALLAIADLQDTKIFDSGRANFVDYTASIVGGLGVEVRSTNESYETQKGLVDQLGTMREQVAGVSLDEEAINMIKYQKAFDASAKMIQVADQMLDTVLNLKRF